jgi:hypothetical protein
MLLQKERLVFYYSGCAVHSEYLFKPGFDSGPWLDFGYCTRIYYRYFGSGNIYFTVLEIS